METAVFRLSPGVDLKQSLVHYCVEHKINAAAVLSCVGSLRCAHLRFADCSEATVLVEKLEIVSLVGTLSQHGCHLHIAVANGHGQVTGGHLLDGSKIYTTAEVLLGIIPDIMFKREHDVLTGYKELKIEDNRSE